MERSTVLRASYFYGSLLGRYGEATVVCLVAVTWGRVTTDLHLQAFEAMGAKDDHGWQLH